MKCSYSEQTLALFAEGDVSDDKANRIRRHLNDCVNCRNVYERLRNSQSFLKSRLTSITAESISRQTLVEVRHSVLSQIQKSENSPDWRLRIDRALWLGYRKAGLAFAGVAIAAIVAAIVLFQGYHPTQAAGPIAVFDGSNTLIRPEGYRDWVFIGSSFGEHATAANVSARASAHSFTNVYINRSAYKQYAQTGGFPEGTMLVLELAKPGSASVAGSNISFGSVLTSLQVSVKDSARFDGGWGFFDFAGENGTLQGKAQALPESRGCRSCHNTCAETDQVFTQFYPILKSTRA